MINFYYIIQNLFFIIIKYFKHTNNKFILVVFEIYINFINL